MQLVGVEPASQEAAEPAQALPRGRPAGDPHHGTMQARYPTKSARRSGKSPSSVAPIEGETVIVKNYPSAFEKTVLDAELKKLGGEEHHLPPPPPPPPPPWSLEPRRRGRFQTRRKARTSPRHSVRMPACRRSATCSPWWCRTPGTCRASGLRDYRRSANRGATSPERRGRVRRGWRGRRGRIPIARAASANCRGASSSFALPG